MGKPETASKVLASPETKMALQTARIGLWSAVFVALIGAFASIAVVVLDRIIAPRVTSNDVAAAIKDSAPNFEFFDLIQTDKTTTKSLSGDWQICTLATAGTVHKSQACTCGIEKGEGNTDWQILVSLDDNAIGDCKCQAACFNFEPKDQ